MNLAQLCQRILGGDAHAANVLSDYCRHKLGMNAASTLQLVQARINISAAQWEELMQEADDEA